MTRSPGSSSRNDAQGGQLRFVLYDQSSSSTASTSRQIRSHAARSGWTVRKQKRKESKAQQNTSRNITSQIAAPHRIDRAKSRHSNAPSSCLTEAGQRQSVQKHARRINYFETVLLEEYPLWSTVGNASDPFNQYPAPWNPVFGSLIEFWNTYINPNWLKEISHGWDEATVVAFANVPLVASVNSSEPAAFYSVLALSAAVLPDTHPLSPGQAPRLSQILQTKAQETLNTAMTKPQQATSNSSIVALVSLACIAMYFGQHEVVRSVYLPVFKSMVEARGGLEQIAREYGPVLRRWIAWGDCVLTSQAGCPPLFPDFEDSSKSSTDWDNICGNVSQSVRKSMR
ncbi:hypothetical protein AAFC00_005279 [Neodothiora populina]|uniref:Uncharacterized protein n=1 Tax=Neodothiora populina TaxID=2781224 RepID=A0ABR3PLH4_9PEZI